MRIYLDNCCLQRPLDNQTQPRIRVETEAVFAVLAAVQAGEQTLLGSEALEYEVMRIPVASRRAEVLSILALASERLLVTDAAEVLAFELEREGLGALDAIHLALASIAQADYFCTCDDKLLRKALNLSVHTCKVISLLDLFLEITA
jgi:predicted nucleic acid-binding protein